jgi:hypothetical protein
MRTGRPATPIERGQKFNKLKTIARAGKDKHGRFLWRCKCECGNEVAIKATYLRTGAKKSCGCLQVDGHSNFRHGHKAKLGASRTYQAWVNMKRRCTDPSRRQWKDYGGRGITYDPAWESFETFLHDMGEPAPGLSLDRKDNDGPYCKANCRWASHYVQRHNSRGPWRWVVIKGEKMTLTEAVRKYSPVTYALVASRLHQGWSEEDAILCPKSHRWSNRSR